MKPKNLTAKKEEQISLFGNCIFAEARLFPYKNPLEIKIPFATLKECDISFTEAKNLITAINSHIGTNKSFIVFLNGSIFKYENRVATMKFTETLEFLDDVSMRDEKDYLILWIYDFIGLEKRFRKTYLNISELVSGFDEKLSKITFGGRGIKVPPLGNEFNFCRVMNKYKINEPVDWIDVWNEIQYIKDGSIPESFYKGRLQDTTNIVNSRVKEALGFKKNLFTWKNKNIIKNF